MKKIIVLAVAAMMATTNISAQEVKPYIQLDQMPQLINILPAPPAFESPEFAFDAVRYGWGKEQRQNAERLAQAIGIPPVSDREAAEKMKGRLVEVKDGEYYRLDSLTHSIPFLVPSAAGLLDRIGSNFQDSLAAKGLNPYKLVVTSVLRTEDDVARLRKGNLNASENSTHRYGTTFDLSYWRYEKVPDLRGRPYEDVPPEYLRATLSQVLKDLHDEGTCYVKYEKKQNCFHITVRK